MHCKIKKDDLKRKIMKSRLFDLQGVSCKIVNCTQVNKERKVDKQTKEHNAHKSGSNQICQYITNVYCIMIFMIIKE